MNRKRLNDNTVILRVPHVHIGELLHSFGEGKVFLTFDLQASYMQNAFDPG